MSVLFWIFVLLAAIGLVVSIPKWFIDAAVERGGKLLVVAEIINVLCIMIAVVGLGTLLLAALGQYLDRYFYEFLVLAGAVAFPLYFYIAKDAAKAKSERTLKWANEIIREYGDALASDVPDNGIARYESNLPASREDIKRAFKLALAGQVYYGSFNESIRSELVSGLMHIGSFVPDDLASQINRGPRTLENKLYSDFATSMISTQIADEMNEFLTQLRTVNPDDPLFIQKAYSLAGVEYSPTLRKKFSFNEYD